VNHSSTNQAMENTASVGAAVAMNVASWNRFSTVDRQRNYVDHISTSA